MKKPIEDLMFPHRDKLVKKDGCFSATIVDAELDEIECVFDGDEAVEINTKGLSYIFLTTQNLNTLIRLIGKAKNK